MLKLRRHMDSLQEQVVTLTTKVDALHQMIDRVNDQISAIVASTYPASANMGDLRIGQPSRGYMPKTSPSLLDTVCEHKDILVDSSYLDLERQNSEANISQDVQIQRLTAQLTAAYHRIAALEEQLLAVRAH
jgi:phage shock protein A